MRSFRIASVTLGLLAGGVGLADEAAAGYTAKVVDRTLLVQGDGAADKLALRASPGRLELDVGDDGTADFDFARDAFSRMRLEAAAATTRSASSRG